MPKATAYPPSKLKQWEKERRERLNACFRDLASALPGHDPAVTLSKVQILQRAAECIRALRGENQTLVDSGAGDAGARQLQALRLRSDGLLRRVEQLAGLLRDAGIAVPSAVPGRAEPFRERQLKWDGKIRPEDAPLLQERAKNKKLENKKVQKWKKKSACDSPSTAVESKQVRTKGSAQRRKMSGKSSTSRCPSKADRIQPPRKQGGLCARDENAPPTSAARGGGTVVCTASVASIPADVGASGASRGKMVVSVTSSNLLAAPVASPGVAARPGPTLVPGTIIFTSGSIVPVLPAITGPAPYLVSADHRPPVVVVQKNAPQPTHKRGKTFPLLIPKRRTDAARAKFPNKVAISASASSFLPLQAPSQSVAVVDAPMPQTNAARAASSNEKPAGSMKRRQVPATPKAAHKRDESVKKRADSNVDTRQVLETCQSADCVMASKSSGISEILAAKSAERDEKAIVASTTQSVINDSKVTKNPKENGKRRNVQKCSRQNVHNRKTKKRICKENANDVKVESKKMRFSEMSATCGESSETVNVKPARSDKVPESGIALVSATDAEKIMSTSSTTLPHVDSGSTVSSDKVSDSLQSYFDSAESEKLSQVAGQHVCIQDSIALSDSTRALGNTDLTRDLTETSVNVVCNVAQDVHNGGSPTVKTPSSDTLVKASINSEDQAFCEVNSASSAIPSRVDIELQEKLSVIPENSANISQVDSSKDEPNSNVRDSTLEISEESLSVCERDVNSKPRHHLGINDSSVMQGQSYSTQSPSHSQKALDQVNTAENCCKVSTQSEPVLFDSVAAQEQPQSAQNSSTSSGVSSGPSLGSVSSEGLQNKVCVDGVAKKNTFATYTIDALCKTSVSGRSDTKSVEKDSLKCDLVSSETKMTCNSGVEGNDLVVNSGARFMEFTESVTASKPDGESEQELKDKNFPSNVSDNLARYWDNASTSQNSSSYVVDGLSQQMVPSGKEGSVFSSVDTNFQSASSCATFGSKSCSAPNESNSDPAMNEQDNFGENQLLSSNNPKLMEQTPDCKKEVCVSEDSKGGFVVTSSSIEPQSDATQNCSVSVALTDQGRDRQVLPVAGKSARDDSKPDAASPSAEGKALGLRTDASDCLPGASPSNVPRTGEELLQPPRCSALASEKLYGEPLHVNSRVPVCDTLHVGVAASYTNSSSVREHVAFTQVPDLNVRSEMLSPAVGPAGSAACTSTRHGVSQNSLISKHIVTSGVNTHSDSGSQLTFSTIDGRCRSSLQHRHEPLASTAATAATAATLTSVVDSSSQSQTLACPASGNKCTVPSQQQNDTAASAQTSVEAVHASQLRPLTPCAARNICTLSPLKQQESVVSHLPSLTSVHTLPQTQPYVTCAVSSDMRYSSSQQKLGSGVSATIPAVPVHAFDQAEAQASFSVGGDKSSPQQKHEPVVSISHTFTPIHTQSLTQQHVTFSNSDKFVPTLQQKYESTASTSNSFTPVNTFAQLQPPQPNVRFSSGISVQQRHEASTFMPMHNTIQTPSSVNSTTSNLAYSEREFSASTFTPVSQILSDIRTQSSAFPNVNCTSASHSWLPTSGNDKSWFSMSKLPNSVSVAHRKTDITKETPSSSANLSLQTNEFPSDIFASLQVPSGGQHPESISPTAAFLLAFPLVSSSKVSDMIDPQDVDCDSLHGASSLLQIGNIDHYSATKKDASTVSSSSQPTNIQPPALKYPLSGKGRAGVNVAETGDKCFTDREFYLPNQPLFDQNHKQNMGTKNAAVMKSPIISTSVSSNMSEMCGRQNIVNRSVGTQFKLTDMGGAKSVMSSAVSKQCTPSSFQTSYSSAVSSVANAVSVTSSHRANASAASGRADLKPNTSFGSHPVFPSAGMPYVAPASSLPVQFHSQDKSRNNHGETPFTITGKEQSFGISVDMSDLKWGQHKSHNFEKQNTAGSFSTSKPDSFLKDRMLQGHSSVSSSETGDLNLYKANLSLHNNETFKYEPSQACSTATSIPNAGQGVPSLVSNPPYNQSVFPGYGYGSVSSHSSVPSYSGNQGVLGVVSSSGSVGVLPWTTSVSGVGHCSGASTSQNVVGTLHHHPPASQFTMPQTTAITANCHNHYGANPNYLPSSKHAAVTSVGQGTVGSNAKNLEGVSTKLTNSFGSKFVKSCEQKGLDSRHQQAMSHEMGMFSSGPDTSVMNSETTDTFKFPLLPDQPPGYQQHPHRPPVNWMTTPAVTTNQSKQAFGMCSSEVPSSSQLDSQPARSSSYFTMANLDPTVFTQSTSSCYGNTALPQNLPSQAKTSSEKQQNTSAAISFANEAPSDSGRSALHNSGMHASQIQQNEFYAAPWTQIKPPFQTETVSADVNNLFVPCTLPTLVGDLALGTGCVLSTVEENNAGKPFSNSDFNEIGQPAKEQKLEINRRQMKNRQGTKDTDRKSKANIDCSHEFASVSHAGVSSVGSSFLSVSQLVDPSKSAADTSGCHASMRGFSTSNGSQTLSSGKHLHHQNASACVKRESRPQSTLSGKDESKKIEHSYNLAGNMTYHVEELQQSLPSHEAKRENSKSDETSARNTLRPATVDNFHWLSAETSSRKSRAGGPDFKTQLGTYSAEALIGISQNTSVNVNASLGSSHKVISLPPPVVSDRFVNQNSYVSTHTQRKVQYDNSTLLPGSYMRPLNLPMSQNFITQPSSVASQQGQPSAALRYPLASVPEPQVSRQKIGGVRPASYFAAGADISHANTVPPAYVPDVAGSSCEHKAPGENKPVSFPSFLYSKESSPPRNVKQSFTYSHASSSASVNQHSGHVRSKTETSSAGSSEVGADKTTSAHGSGRQGGGGMMPSQNIAGGNCALGKQRGRRRAPDAASVSSVGNLVDLGYLGMPPGIGSPMLGEEGMYFHGGPPALYPGIPNAQGPFYPPPRAAFAPSSAAAASPSAANSGGTTLANFNLSTIFPEIMDKASSVSAAAFPFKQPARQPLMGACAAGTPGFPRAPPTNINAFPHANTAAARPQWL
ncbi:uncharacterized protein LOC134538977 isoform X2 [Bacillus rossius redtenbacheri]|uniref:uncharacterized protein LOC134538977 isoform X2 n=1 Tax=Bacillus rossius redtenbacheri TaxID=93214 RepID=UPI002FDEEEB3